VNSFRIGLKVAALAVATFVAAMPPAVVRLISRRPTGLTARVSTRCCSWWGSTLCRIIGVRITVHGKPEGSVFLVAANHLSYLDIFVLASVYPSIFVAKREIAGWPLFGWITRHVGTVFVDRARPRDVVRAGKAMREHLRDGTPLTLFPEGMATCGAEVLPFMPSLLEAAATTGVPCFAASLNYDTPGHEAPPSQTVCWWGGADFFSHFMRLLTLPRIEARVEFSRKPIVSNDRKLLARVLREEVASCFVPVRQDDDYSRSKSQTSAPLKSQGNLPSSQSAASAEKTTSVK